MCGFGGLVQFSPDEHRVEQVAGPLAAALAHRGPDDEGVYTSADRRAVLVHRRLAIIAPTRDAAQPMTFAGRYHLAFNGEIYNFRELRTVLEGAGDRFTTAGDTEVLLRWIVRRGVGALDQVRGMFALALWDARARTLLLARDRFGIKPLYVAQGPRHVAFASEIGALRAAGLTRGQVSAAGVLAYLAWGSIAPPLTWLDDVRSLEPGGWSRWDADGAVTHGRFADPRAAYCDARGSNITEDELRSQVKEAFRDSVRAHLVADVPVGVFLSGGIDSAAIVAAASRLSPDTLRTYTVVAEEDPSSEEVRAAASAAQFSTAHQVVRVRASDMVRDIPRMLEKLDQPSLDGVNTFVVAHAVARTGIKVVLSGVGGDEMFGGYPSFRRLPRAWQWNRFVSPGLAGAVARAAGARIAPWQSVRLEHLARSGTSRVETFRALRGLLLPPARDALAGPALRDPAVWLQASSTLAELEETRLAPAGGTEGALASVARLESAGYLVPQLLRDVDAMSMAHGLEVRVPFVDHVLLAATWPALGAHPALLRRKRLLRDVAAPLPDAVTTAAKRGFTLPFDAWLNGPLSGFVRDGLRELASSGWIAAEAPDREWKAWTDGTAHWSRPWSLGVLGQFVSTAARCLHSC